MLLKCILNLSTYRNDLQKQTNLFILLPGLNLKLINWEVLVYSQSFFDTVKHPVHCDHINVLLSIFLLE